MLELIEAEVVCMGSAEERQKGKETPCVCRHKWGDGPQEKAWRDVTKEVQTVKRES